MVNFGPVTPEFKRVKVVHSSLISSSATFASLIDLAGSVLSFSGAITTQFCFTYTLEGITAMPRGLHARFCYAFLVLVFSTFCSQPTLCTIIVLIQLCAARYSKV